MSIRTRPWRIERRWPDLMNDIFFYIYFIITWMARYLGNI